MILSLKEVRLLIENILKLDEKYGTLMISKNTKLQHTTNTKIIKNIELSSNTNRLIPNSFSLGLPGQWWMMGKYKINFRLKVNYNLLQISKKQFFEWGPDVATPIERGILIYQWAKNNNIDIIKLNLKPIMDIEYAILNLDCIEQI